MEFLIPRSTRSTTLAQLVRTRARVGLSLQNGDRQRGEVQGRKHVLGVGVNLDGSFGLQSGDLGYVVVATLALLLLKLDGDATHGGLLDTAHQMCGETSNLVAEFLGGDNSDLLNDTLVGLEIISQASVVLLDDQLRGLLDGLGADATLWKNDK